MRNKPAMTKSMTCTEPAWSDGPTNQTGIVQTTKERLSMKAATKREPRLAGSMNFFAGEPILRTP
jgi:hypothetical protein